MRLHYAEYLLYRTLWVTLIVFGVYGYLVGPMPLFALLKDGLLVTVAAMVVLDFLQRRALTPVNAIDVVVWSLFLYMLAELVYTTVRIDSFPVAYLGFRLDFMPILLYFGFRRVDHQGQLRSLHRLFVGLLIVGTLLTLLELGLTVSGLVSPTFLFELLNYIEHRHGVTLGNLPRVIGIAGTPHITGIYHVILLALLLFLVSQPAERLAGLPRFCRSPRWIGVLTLLAAMAALLSTSKTAWVLLPVVVALSVVSRRRLGWSVVVLVLAMVLVTSALVFWVDPTLYEAAERQAAHFMEVYADFLHDFTEGVLRDSPVVGYGYEYDLRVTALQAPRATLENQPLAADIYFAAVLRMLGGIGLGLFALVFGLIPLALLLVPRYSVQGRGAALGVLTIGLAFVHYSPLTAPVTSTAAWYLAALMSREWSLRPAALPASAAPEPPHLSDSRAVTEGGRG